jgi:AbrB family looped-hinge helix DNA binding protein
MIIEKYVRVGERGQIAIPKEIRDNEGIVPEDMVKLMSVDGDIIIRTQKRAQSPEDRILELLQKSKLGDRDWEEIQRERAER